MNRHEFYMRRCIELARNGLGRVSPNPLVGAVVVHNDIIIGEGYHAQYGQAHAEVNAINSVKDTSLWRDAAIYVSLEPCAHFGKTPPCANLIIDCGIPKVVIGSPDLYYEVNGKGIAMLQEAGIHVTTGVLEDDCLELNKRFFTYHGQKRPYIILKWAETADGFIAREDYSSKWISHGYSRLLVHKWRMEEDAVMVGANTALYDNPGLSARDMGSKFPVKILIDPNGKVPASHQLFNSPGKTIVFGKPGNDRGENVFFFDLDFASPDVLHQVMQTLWEEKVQSVIVEGGSFLLNSLLQLELWDEARVFTSPVAFGSGIAAPVIQQMAKSSYFLEKDKLSLYYR